jgi:hypothetical protein
MATAVSFETAKPPRAGPERLVPGLLYGGAATAISFVAASSPAWILALVTLATAAAFVVVWRMQFQGRLSYADPGIFFVFVICLYTAIPLLVFEYYDFNFGIEGDSRLNHIALDQRLISDVWLCANLAIAGFGSAYLVIRQPRMPRLREIPDGARSALWIGLILSATMTIVAYLGRGGSGAYTDEYLFFRGLPTLVVQMLNILSAMFQVCAFGLFAYYIAKGRTIIAVALLAASLAFSFVVSDARTNLVMLAGGFFIARDHLAKRFSPAMLASGAVLGLAIFLLLGLTREGLFAISDAAGRSEFMSVFVTALDVQQLYITGSTMDMNVNLLVSDLFRLIPQQLLTFEKVDPASWYVVTFYPAYAEAGGGLAFGMISEAVLGGGGFAALLRGLALGVVASLAFNFLTRHGSIWRMIIYIWVFISLYQCFRDTTFSLFGRFAFQFAPALLITFAFSHLLSARGSTAVAGRAGARRPGSGAPSSF